MIFGLASPQPALMPGSHFFFRPAIESSNDPAASEKTHRNASCRSRRDFS